MVEGVVVVGGAATRGCACALASPVPRWATGAVAPQAPSSDAAATARRTIRAAAPPPVGWRAVRVRGAGILGLVLLALVGTSCAATGHGTLHGRRDLARSDPSTTTSTAPPATTTSAPPPTTTTQPPFTGAVSAVTAADLPSTYRPGCPVGPADLRMLRMSFWGFDGQTHVGTMVVNASAASAVLSVFSTLYAEHFPIRKMQPVDAYGGSDAASTADDNTAGFNCRYAVAPGPPSWSAHAYGDAIDVNPFENPYIEGGQVQPAGATAYADRADVRPGMAEPGGQLVEAFAAVGWQWGGRWTDSPDYQHFSATGN